VSKPVPGQWYTVGNEKTFQEISIAAVGHPNLSARIVSENRIPGPVPYPGLQLVIPFVYEELILKETGSGGPTDRRVLSKERPNEEFSKWLIEIEGIPVLANGVKYTRALSNACIECTAVMPWDTDQMTSDNSNKLAEYLKPYAYPKVKVFLGGYRMLTGVLFGVKNVIGTSGISKAISMASLSANMIDSTMIAPLQYRDMTLKQIAEKVCGRFGIPVRWYSRDKNVFKRAACEDGERCFEFVCRLAKQRGVLIGCDETGAMTFCDTEDSIYVGEIVEGQSAWVPGLEFDFDGRKRFSKYTAKSKSGRTSAIGTVNDLSVPFGRTTTVEAEDCHDGDIKKAAEWHRSRIIADALSQTITVRGFIAPDGDYWEEGLTLTLYSKSMEIPNGYTFLVDQVTMGSDSAESTELVLVPPGLYSGKPMENPWPKDGSDSENTWAAEDAVYKKDVAVEKAAMARRARNKLVADASRARQEAMDAMDETREEHYEDIEGMSDEEIASTDQETFE